MTASRNLHFLSLLSTPTFVAVETNGNRYFIEIAYQGGAYHGWQVQPNARTIQELLDQALTTLLKRPTETVGCGRTDTGVHARQFYAHFDVLENGDPIHTNRFLHSLNSLLPHDIAAKQLVAVAPTAHARFDAVKRSYEYHVHFQKDPFLHGQSWQLRDIPDVAAMNAAAAILYDYEDFSCFSKSNTQVHTNNCRILHAEWRWANERQLVFHISANRFLRNMVRAIVGTLLDIGQGNRRPEDLHAIIRSKNRSMAGTSVPACGLYLTEVAYPPAVRTAP